MLFDGWASVVRTAVTGVLAYLALVALLRTSGSRTLSKLNAFDLVVTVALGSTLATILLSRDVPLVTGITAFAVLIAMQYAVAWLSIRSRGVEKITRSEPRLLLHRGSLLRDAMRDERVTESEVLSVLRTQGIPDMGAIHAVVLETDGTFSVVPNSPEEGTAMRGVRGYPEEK